MKYYIIFAWRNLWRNRKRTLLATSSIFFAVFLALAMRSMQFGQYNYMVDSTVSMFTGYLQIQGKDFWENRSFDESIEFDDSLDTFLKNIKEITTINPRLESGALISFGMETRITPVFGINPYTEDKMTGLRKKIVKGKYLEDNSNGILIAEGLAERLKVNVGDSVILFGQGYRGVTAAEFLPIEGIVKYPIPKMNNAMTFVALNKAQSFFNAENRITSISIMLNSASQMDAVQSVISKNIDSNLVVMNWEEMAPELVQAIEADSAGGVIMLFILYVVIGFGVFGTIMMMTIERTREFGLLISLGMTRTRLYLVTAIESFMISMVGALIGIIISLPVLIYLYYHPIPVTGELADIYLVYGMEPIIPFSISPSIFTSQALVVFLIGFVCSLYPMLFIRKIKPVSALQGRGGFK